jgi:hypothetical protein
MKTQIVGLVEISVQHELDQELEFKELILYDFAILKARMVHRKYCIFCDVDAWSCPKAWGPGQPSHSLYPRDSSGLNQLKLCRECSSQDYQNRTAWSPGYITGNAKPLY